MGKRGPKKVFLPELKLFAHLYFHDFCALAKGRPRKSIVLKKYQQAIQGLEKLKLSFGKRLEICADVKRQLRETHFPIAESEAIIVRDLEMIERYETVQRRLANAEEIALPIRRGPDAAPDLVALLNAANGNEVRLICRGAFRTVSAEVREGQWQDVEVPRWPIDQGSMFPYYLSEYAEQFVAARNEPRYPRSTRPSSEAKRLWFSACAVAAGVTKIEIRTAINKLGSMPPSDILKVYF